MRGQFLILALGERSVQSFDFTPPPCNFEVFAVVVRLDRPLFLAVGVTFEKSALLFGEEKQTTENNVRSIFSLT